MRVNRENFLKALESVTSGLAPKEIIDQSGCFVFKDGYVMTFNDEVACRAKSPLNITGAVKSKPLLDVLSKWPDEDIDIKAEGDELMILGKAKNRKSGIAMEAQVLLPVDHVEEPGEWKELNQELVEGIRLVHTCASTEESNFSYCCIHLTPNFVEASDRFQIARYRVETGIENPILIRADSARHLIGLNLVAFNVSEGNWIHFKGADGLVMSIRCHVEEYADYDRVMTKEGTEPVTLPQGLNEVIDRSQVFSREDVYGNIVTVELNSKQVVVEGRGPSGWHKERKQVTYKGEPIKFVIYPKLLMAVSDKSTECRIGEGKLFVDLGKFLYATCTEPPKDEQGGED